MKIYKFINYTFLLSIMITLVCLGCIRERNCERHTQCPNAPLMLEYFGNYKPGNYWIYENQDGTKKDSIYVDNYSKYQYKSGESYTKDQNDCIEYPVTTFNIYSRYWGNSKILKGEISNSGSCKGSFFGFFDTLNYGIFGLEVTASDDTFKSTQQLINFTTHTNKTVIYPKGLKYSNLYSLVLCTPKIGIVQFVTRNTLDTFSLTNYYIQ